MARNIDLPIAVPFSLDRPLAFIDLETTGLRINSDRIVELALLRIDPSGEVIERVRRFHRGIPIPAEVTEIHGITDADVENEEPFASRAKALNQLLDGCDLAGFNIRRFDLPLLMAEFRRAGIEFEIGRRRIVDAQQIFFNEEPRSLGAAAKTYLDFDHKEAHGAAADVHVTAAVLFAQLKHYPHLPQEMDGLNAYCDAVGPVRTSVTEWFSNQDGNLVFRRGKHEGKPLHQVAAQEPGYLNWMLTKLQLDESAQVVLNQALNPDD